MLIIACYTVIVKQNGSNRISVSSIIPEDFKISIFYLAVLSLDKNSMINCLACMTTSSLEYNPSQREKVVLSPVVIFEALQYCVSAGSGTKLEEMPGISPKMLNGPFCFILSKNLTGELVPETCFYTCEELRTHYELEGITESSVLNQHYELSPCSMLQFASWCTVSKLTHCLKVWDC